MDSDSHYKGLRHDTPFMSLSVGGFSHGSRSSEGLSRDTMLMLKTQPCGWRVDENTCDTRIALQSAPRENPQVLSCCEIPKGMKRKRPNSDVGCRGDFKNLEVEDDSGLVLGLGRTASPSDSGVSSGSRTSSGTMFMKGIDEGSPVNLGLGLTGPSSHDLMNGCIPSVISGGASSALTSVDSEVGMYHHANQNPGSGSNILLRLGRLQCSSGGDIESGGGMRKGFGVVSPSSAENDPGMHLQLGLSGNSAVVTDSDCVSGMPLGLGHGGTLQEIRSESFGGEQIPVVDEGSTSARWLKSGGYIPSLLMGRRLDSVNHVTAPRIDGMNQLSGVRIGMGLSAQDNILEPDLSMSIRASSGTTSTSGASGGLPDRASKTCKFRGCGKGARGASGLCIAHGGGRRCQKQGCNKGAEGRTVYCKAHGGGRRCQCLGCTKSAEGKTEYCISHGGGRRCSKEDCSKAARGRSGLCIRHGGGKRCQKEGCTKSAEGYSGLCISHGGGRRCQFPSCGKGAQGSTMFCKAHGGGKRCMIQGCNKGAEGSTPLCKGHGGGKRCMFDGGGICTKSVHGGTSYCVAHGGGKRCAVQGCTKSARGRTDYCVRHGGGKRCKFENCGKSAQGSTDFCKAHGGGKRCSWGQEGSPYSGEFLRDKTGELLTGPCDRFARGKIGLCAAHSALVQDRRVHGVGTLGNALPAGLGPGLFRGLVSGTVHKGQNYQSSSDASKQSANAGNEHGDDHSSGSGGSESPMHTCASPGALGGELTGRDNEACYPGGSQIARGRQGFPQSLPPGGLDLDLSVLENRPLNKMNVGVSSSSYGSSSFWPVFSYPFQHTDGALNNNVMDAAAGKIGFPSFAGVQQAHRSSGTRIQASEAGPSFHHPLIPPQVLVPLSMQKGNFIASHEKEDLGQTGPTSASDEGIFNMSSLSLPDERVHGGSLMALMSKEAGGRDSMQRMIGLGTASAGVVGVDQQDNQRRTQQYRLEQDGPVSSSLSDMGQFLATGVDGN